MSTTSGWTANMRSRLSHQSHFASIRTARDSLTPPTQRRRSTHLSRIVPRSACSQATSAACSTKTCPTASPTSPATLSSPTPQRHPKPQWWRNVSSLIMCANPGVFFLTNRKSGATFSTYMISLIAVLLLPCSAWSVLLQSCSGLVLTLMTLVTLLEIHWLWTRRQTAAYLNTAPIIIRLTAAGHLKLCVCKKCNKLTWMYLHNVFSMPLTC